MSAASMLHGCPVCTPVATSSETIHRNWNQFQIENEGRQTEEYAHSCLSSQTVMSMWIIWTLVKSAELGLAENWVWKLVWLLQRARLLFLWGPHSTPGRYLEGLLFKTSVKELCLYKTNSHWKRAWWLSNKCGHWWLVVWVAAVQVHHTYRSYFLEFDIP